MALEARHFRPRKRTCIASLIDGVKGRAKAVWNSSNEASSGSWVSISTPSLFIITLRACAQPRISAGAKCAPVLGLQISRATKFSTHIAHQPIKLGRPSDSFFPIVHSPYVVTYAYRPGSQHLVATFAAILSSLRRCSWSC